MPVLTRWFIKTALLYLMAALALGTAMQSRALRTALPILAAAGPAYLHLLVVGWITGVIVGVAYWLFPRPARDRLPVPTQLGWITYGCLNVGLLLRVSIEPVVTLMPNSRLRWLLPLSGVLQFAGAATFAALIWPRVRTR